MSAKLAVNNKELSAGVGVGGEEVVGSDNSNISSSSSGGGVGIGVGGASGGGGGGGGGRSRSTGGGGGGGVVERNTHERNSADLLASNIEKPSRDPSPIRMNLSSTGLSDSNITPAFHYKNRRKPGSLRSAAASRETSPIRSVSAVAAAVLRNSQQPDLQQPRPQGPLANAHHWPSTSRLGLSKSPPPGSRSPAPSLHKKSEHTTSAPPPPLPSIVLRRDKEKEVGLEDPGDQNLSGMKTPRSNTSPALETVVEGSLPNTPASGTSKTLTEQVAALAALQSNSSTNAIHEESESEVSVETVKGRSRAASISSSISHSLAESESESGYKSEDRTSRAAARVPPPTRSFSRRQTVMGSDNFSGRMTVETETVTSVPQVALGAGVLPGGASIRSKKSTDTIRAPKKKEKKVLKRAGGGGNSNLTSKTDIFAAKIAEAVDEANSSDSEETFVYESNPPEPPTIQRPTSRFHSRTPSATSIQGGPDPRGQRLPLFPSIDGQQSTGRKGMKFTSVNSNLGNETPVGDGVGNERGGSGGGGSRIDERRNQKEREKNGGRSQNGPRSVLTDESPFHNGQSQKISSHSLRHGSGSHVSLRSTSQSNTPRHGSALRNGFSSKKSPRTKFDPEMEGADDERIPLIRPTRVRRRPGSGSHRQEHNTPPPRRGWFKNYIGCIVAVVAVMLIMTGVGGFLFATTKALVDVSVLKVTGVLVSKQEIMLDLVVEAINPNAISVTVGAMDVNLFAKSSHVGDGKGKDGGDPLSPGDGDDDDRDHKHGWWQAGRGRRRQKSGDIVAISSTEHLSLSATRIRYRTILAINKGEGHVDEGTDPPEDLPEGGDRQTMLLGRIFAFDSALTFDASPIRHKSSISIGELRLAKPGNKTEEGGTERWERVLQHPFELIVRGVLRYSLPLSGRIRTAPIGASVLVHPDGATKDIGNGYEYYDDTRNDKFK